MTHALTAPTALPDGLLPWTRSCFVCGESNPHGLKLRARHEAGRVVLRYAPRPADLGWRTIVHGGIGATLLDEVMTWAAILRSRRACVAAEITVRMRSAIAVGQPLRIEGFLEGGRSRLLLASGRILDAAGVVLVEASGKFVPMAAALAGHCSEDFVEDAGTISAATIFATG